MKQLLISLFSLSILFNSQTLLAAACCGGGFAAPAIIAGDDKAQLSTSYSFTEVTVDNVDSNGVWKKWDHHQQVQTLRLEGAHIITDRVQAGFTLPVIQRSRMNQSYSGLGDVSSSLGYEYLTNWDYNPWKPKGIGYMQLTLPTGKSKMESEIGGLDSRGNGLWAFGVGTILSKSWNFWDTFSSVEVHKSFEKKIQTSQISGVVSPGYGGNFAIGSGYNFESWRLGAAVSWTYEDPIHIRGTSNSKGSVERYATGNISASYLANDNWAGTLSYADQTLFGSPVNTSLGQTVALQLQRRWGR